MPHPRIDMVFTYVDGSDPVYAARRAELRRAWRGASETPDERAVWSRGVGEITYAVRSVLRAMPWIGTIHIVTDGQHPPVDRELIDSGRVRVVDHGEIVPPEYRPVFASTIIESFLHRIPGLSEVWLYNNDDFLHGSAIEPAEFCEPTAAGGVRLRLRTVSARIRVAIHLASDWSPGFLPRANAYTSGISNSALLLRRRLPWRDVVFPRHVTQVYRTAAARRLEELFADELHAARLRHFRSVDQLSWSTLAYSAECHWYGAIQRRYRPPILPGESDELFLDFNLIRAPGRLSAAWQRVRVSQAKFICLNNIPESQAAAFEHAMTHRGLKPLAPSGR